MYVGIYSVWTKANDRVVWRRIIDTQHATEEEEEEEEEEEHEQEQDRQPARNDAFQLSPHGQSFVLRQLRRRTRMLPSLQVTQRFIAQRLLFLSGFPPARMYFSLTALNRTFTRWRHQLWGTGARAHSTSNNLIWGVTLQLHKV